MMEYEEWEPYYLEILRDFGFSREMDRKAGIVLAELLKYRNPVGKEDLRGIISGKEVLIVGPRAESIERKEVIIATDSSTSLCLEKGIVPDIISTDLDGDVEDEIRSSIMGSIVLVHAHGDNIGALRKYVPKMRKVGGTVQCEPFPPLMNFGGFTDGDRAVFMANSLGAEKIYLTGFDFENPVEKPGMDIEIKKRKLVWAERLISLFDVQFI